jgi:hypothetical protein
MSNSNQDLTPAFKLFLRIGGEFFNIVLDKT